MAPGAVLTLRAAGLNKRAHPIVIGAGLLAHGCIHLDTALAGRGGALLVVDANLGPALLQPLIRRLESMRMRWGVCVVRAEEQAKSPATLERILIEAARLRLERGDAVIALGGGIVTDLAGFAAATYRRGIAAILIPTTLLAMVDAAIGGKTGLNLDVPMDDDAAGTGGSQVAAGSRSAAGGAMKTRLIKNAAGAFHLPALVVCDPDALRTLPLREVRCGLAECIKHAVLGPALGDAKLWAWTAANLDAILRAEMPALSELIRRNAACKVRVVETDERETSTKADGGRMMLNLGHTFAHALETLPGLSWRDAEGRTQIGPLRHGEAVGLGLLAAVRVSEEIGLLKQRNAKKAQGKGTRSAVRASTAGNPRSTAEEDSGALSHQLIRVLRRVGLPTAIDGLPRSETVLSRMIDDKKVKAGRVRLVLPSAGGECRVRDDVDPAVVVAALESLRAVAPLSP
ncbi:3-dehydroquinate synthase [soil metagenome]